MTKNLSFVSMLYALLLSMLTYDDRKTWSDTLSWLDSEAIRKKNEQYQERLNALNEQLSELRNSGTKRKIKTVYRKIAQLNRTHHSELMKIRAKSLKLAEKDFDKAKTKLSTKEKADLIALDKIKARKKQQAAQRKQAVKKTKKRKKAKKVKSKGTGKTKRKSRSKKSSK